MGEERYASLIVRGAGHAKLDGVCPSLRIQVPNIYLST